MVITNYLDYLESLVLDKQTGISILRLTQDETFSLYFASIQQGSTLPAHYHHDGIEAFQIISGEGEIEIGRLLDDDVAWTSKTSTKPGDCFSIQSK